MGNPEKVLSIKMSCGFKNIPLFLYGTPLPPVAKEAPDTNF